MAPIEPYFKYIYVALLAWVISNIATLSLRTDMLPKDKPPPQIQNQSKARSKSRGDYGVITAKNIFNEDNKIPESLGQKSKGDLTSPDAPAVLSKLGLQLMGTIVHINPEKSVASIEVQAKNLTSAFRVGTKIETLAEVTKIERRRVEFINLKNNRKEYIEIPEDIKLSMGLMNSDNSAKVSTGSGKFVKRTGENEYNVSRSDLKRFTDPSKLKNVLNQARMEPNYGPNGVEGFSFKWIKPGSIFEELGFSVGDVITGVDGEPINDPRKAMEAYNALKNSTNIRLNVIRGGAREEINYSVSE